MDNIYEIPFRLSWSGTAAAASGVAVRARTATPGCDGGGAAVEAHAGGPPDHPNQACFPQSLRKGWLVYKRSFRAGGGILLLP